MVRVVVDAPLAVQPLQHQLNGVDMPVREILVGAEKILQKRDVLTEPGMLPEGGGGFRVVLAGHVPEFRLQGVDAVPAAHEVHETAAQIST